MMRWGDKKMKSREVIRRLEANGWKEVRQSGSHKQFRHPDIKGVVTVPHPKADLPTGTLKSIEKQSGLSLI
jgi:predicted RNA binding protein YcfA (HicA-like mRNA interferase family)